MYESWQQTAAWYEPFSAHKESSPMRAAHFGVSRLARHIASGRLASILYGWRSMFDLFVTQTDQEPFSYPHLKISAQDSGLVEFRYVDTAIPNRQWHRSVPPDLTIDRFERFLCDLRWVANPS